MKGAGISGLIKFLKRGVVLIIIINIMKLSYLLQNTLVFEFKALNYHLRKSGTTKKMIESIKTNIEELE